MGPKFDHLCLGATRLVGMAYLYPKYLLELESFRLTHQRQDGWPPLNPDGWPRPFKDNYTVDPHYLASQSL